MGIKSRHSLKMGINQNNLKSTNAYKIGVFQVSRIQTDKYIQMVIYPNNILCRDLRQILSRDYIQIDIRCHKNNNALKRQFWRSGGNWI